jgi:4'-phosphopantetheinyl transferase EntD
MMERILPDTVVVEDIFGDVLDAALFPEEEALLTRSVEKRRREFTTGRACARAALRRLGVPPGPILPGERGAPVWPAGVVGTITHCDGYRAAAVARTRDMLALGLDAEPNDVLPEGVLDLVANPDERAWIAEWTAAHAGVHWDRMLFSAKESVYKAWFPLARRWLDFSEATLTVDPHGGTFTAHLLVPGITVSNQNITSFHGRWMVARGLVLTAICVPRRCC